MFRNGVEKLTLNRVDVDKFQKTIENARKAPLSGKKTIQVEGEWRIGKTGPQFEAKIETEKGGEFLIQSDETIALGGGGTAPNPVIYGLYGVMACYAATFSKWTAMESIELKTFKVKAQANLDLTRSFGVTQNQIYENIKFEIIVDADIGIIELKRFNEITKERCPCYYCLTNAIIPEIEIRSSKT